MALNPNCQCLPCVLRRALDTWRVNNYLDAEGTIDQLGKFVSEAISALPRFKGKTIGLAVLEELPDGSHERLH